MKNLFPSLNLPLSINTTSNDPLKDFFIPVLGISIKYDVAVGYFTSAWIRDAAEGIAHFACNGGEARWIISPMLSKDDYKLLSEASEIDYNSKIETITTNSFNTLYEQLKDNTRTVLSWLIRDGILNFRIAIPKKELSGMMHAKMGIFEDSCGNKISFSGSYNLTSAAATNWEKIDIYCGWRSEESQQRIIQSKFEFENMWSGTDTNLAIFEPSEECVQRFIVHTETYPRPYVIDNSEVSPVKIPDKYLISGKPREYQTQAVKLWVQNGAQGILAMATGTGKTVTALSAATLLANHAVESGRKKSPRSILIIITVPYKHLAIQWAQEANLFKFRPIVCFSGTGDWQKKCNNLIINLNSGITNFEMLITVNNTFAGEKFQKVINSFKSDILLIADEMHNLGSQNYLNFLPEKIKLRLGLSATPIRHGDLEGTQELQKYFGKVIYEFPLKRAIDEGYLCQYQYTPILCPLNNEEMAIYKQLSSKIARICASQDTENIFDDRLTKLLVERARLVSRIESKLTNLISLLGQRKESKYNLVYCGDASDNEDKHLNKVIKELGTKLNMRVNKITFEENPIKRKEILKDFSSGLLQTIVAMKCLDEGVDIPRTETAYILASSANPRQYIQRRGRVLRKSPEKSRAYIYDFIAVPDLDQVMHLDEDAFKTERNLLKRELERINEFAELAINYGETIDTLSQLKRAFKLTGV